MEGQETKTQVPCRGKLGRKAQSDTANLVTGAKRLGNWLPSAFQSIAN